MTKIQRCLYIKVKNKNKHLLVPKFITVSFNKKAMNIKLILLRTLAVKFQTTYNTSFVTNMKKDDKMKIQFFV